jgi:hypothetical protein
MVAVKVTDWLTAADGTEETTVAVVGVKPTTCESTPETLPVKFESPLVYVATTLLVPDEVKVKLQTGTTPAASALLHNTVAVDVSVKTTVPVGLAVPVNPGVTTAVKATDWLTPEAAGNDERLVVVVVAVTGWERTLEVPLLKLEFELVNAAEIRCVPAVANAAGQAGTFPETARVTAHSVVPVDVSV